MMPSSLHRLRRFGVLQHTRGGRGPRRSRRPLVALALTLAAAAACSPSSLIDVQAPSTVVDPSLISSASAAAQLRTGALVWFMGALTRVGNSSVIGMSGQITDELASTTPYCSNDCHVLNQDSRVISNFNMGGDQSGYDYDILQSARVKALQAQQALQLYASNTPSVPRAWQGEMYALEAYTVLFFAENYCSGIPLTVVPITGAQTPTRGFTTTELFTRAVTLFDSALVMGADSAQFVNLASVGKARALLGLGQFAAADSAIQQVPTDFLYVIKGVTSDGTGMGYNYMSAQVGSYRVEDNEGGNGLVWSTDPRTAIAMDSTIAQGMLFPAKYHITPSGVPDPNYTSLDAPVRLADGLEARLIHAEAALYANDGSWLTTLNDLRATCIGATPCAPVPGLTTASLPPLTDPGSANTRLDLLMKERAMWLYLTGHREADLRRLARIYHRDINTLWPRGRISAPAFPPLMPVAAVEDGSQYGTDLVYGPDINEHIRNPLYGGCYDTNP